MFRGCLNNLGYDDIELIKVYLCYEFKWSEKQFNESSFDFIVKCIIYLDEKRRKEKKEKKANQKNITSKF